MGQEVSRPKRLLQTRNIGVVERADFMAVEVKHTPTASRFIKQRNHDFRAVTGVARYVVLAELGHVAHDERLPESKGLATDTVQANRRTGCFIAPGTEDQLLATLMDVETDPGHCGGPQSVPYRVNHRPHARGSIASETGYRSREFAVGASHADHHASAQRTRYARVRLSGIVSGSPVVRHGHQPPSRRAEQGPNRGTAETAASIEPWRILRQGRSRPWREHIRARRGEQGDPRQQQGSDRDVATPDFPLNQRRFFSPVSAIPRATYDNPPAFPCQTDLRATPICAILEHFSFWLFGRICGCPKDAQTSGSPSAGRLRPTLSAVARSLRSLGRATADRVPSRRLRGRSDGGEKNVIKLDVGFDPPARGDKSARKASRTAFPAS